MKLFEAFLSKFLLTIVFLVVLGSLANAQQVESFLVKPDSIQVGDTLIYSVKVSNAQSFDKIIYPDSSHFGEYLEIKNRQRFKLPNGSDSVAYTLQFFGTQDTLIQSLPVYFVTGKDTVARSTPQELLTFASALDGEEFKPLKPIFDFAAEYWPYVLGILLLLLLGYLIYRYLQKRKTEPETKQKPEAPPVFQDPLRQLEETIKQLQKQTTFNTSKQIKTFYIDIGDAIRLYFERLYDIPALESSTTEFLRDLESQYVNPDQINRVKEILREADMVKFAKFTPPPDRFEKVLMKAEQIARQAEQEDRARINRMKELFVDQHKNGHATPEKAKLKETNEIDVEHIENDHETDGQNREVR